MNSKRFSYIYILRHGIAVERGTSGLQKDQDRPLTPKGRRQLRRITRAMKALGVSFDLILSSPYLRARQTAEIVAKAFKAQKRVVLNETLAADRDPKDVITFLQHLDPRPESVLLVGHEPYLSELISRLVAGNSSCAVELKKGGLAKLELASLKAKRSAILQWLLTPRQMMLMD